MRYLDVGQPVVLAFPTPFFRHRWPEAETGPVNAALKAEILARRESSPGTHVSNVGGWQSDPDIMTWGLPELEPLQKWINQAFSEIMHPIMKLAEARQLEPRWREVNPWTAKKYPYIGIGMTSACTPEGRARYEQAMGQEVDW